LLNFRDDCSNFTEAAFQFLCQRPKLKLSRR
jgi:hypothetical protein